MRTLTSAERRALRAKAHHLHPFVSIGQQGLTPAVLHEIDVNLLAHELIKIRVFSDERTERDALLQRICAELDAAPVQHLGKILTVWRPKPEPEAPVARPRAKPAAGTGNRRRAPPREPAPRSRAAPAIPRGKPPKSAPADPASRHRKPPPRSGTATALTAASRARRRRATREIAVSRQDAPAGAKPFARRSPASTRNDEPAKRPPRGEASGKSRKRASSVPAGEKPHAAAPGARRRRTPR